LGLCQWGQNKLSEARRSLQRGVALAPDSLRIRHLLAKTFIDAGRPRDALTELERIVPHLPDDESVSISHLRACLLLGRDDEAMALAQQFVGDGPTAQLLLTLGHAYDEARRDPEARAQYQRAVELGFCPEALMMLASQQVSDQPELARSHFLTALDLTQTAPEDTRDQLELMQGLLTGLSVVDQQTSDAAPQSCQTWTAVAAQLPERFGANQRLRVWLYAPSEDWALAQVRTLAEALRPGQDWSATGASLKLAERELRSGLVLACQR
jgi:hypothetical protein